MKIKLRYKGQEVRIPIDELLKGYEKSVVSYLKDFNRLFECHAEMSKPSGEKASGDTEILYANGHDISNYLSRYGMANYQIQAIMKLDGRLEFDRLRRAVRLSVDEEPVFGCRFIEGDPPYWRRRDNIDEISFCTIEETADIDEAVKRFLESNLDMDNDPMVKVKLMRSEQYDVLGLKINHACTDGGGAKEYIHLLADIYSRIGPEDETFTPIPRIAGRKDQDRMFAELGIKRPERKWNPIRGNPKTVWTFPWKQGGSDSVRYVISQLPDGGLDSVISYGKARGATVNDLILAAYYRAMFEISRPLYGVPMDIICTVDLRRYLPDGKTTAIRNFSGGFDTRIARIKGETFEGTLARVKRETKKAKDGKPGLNNAMGGESIEKVSFMQFRTYVKTVSQTSRFASQLPSLIGNVSSPGLSNLGFISKSLISFGSIPVTDAYIIPPVVRAPGFLMVASSYNGVMTVCIGYYKGSVRRNDMQRIVDKTRDELMKGCAEVKE